MLSAFVSPLRKLVGALLADHSASQLAAGFTVGMVIGMMPKGNLIALSLCVLLFSLRCNKGLALVAAVVFSCVAPWIDPIAHQVGAAALRIDSLQAAYASALSLPLGPWFAFNNTVVAGSLLLGLYVAYPAYWATRAICGLCRREAAP